MDRIERGTRGDRNFFPRLTIHRALCAAGLAFAALSAHAVALGEIDVRSHLGEPLDARIPVSGADAAHLEDDCFAITRLAPPGMTAGERGAARLERANGATWLRVRSTAPMREPAMMLGIRASCPGTQGGVLREYGVLLDPVRTAAAAPALEAVALPVVERAAATSGPAVREPARTLAESSGTAAKRTHARHAAPVKNRAARHDASRGHAPAQRPAGDAYVLKLSGPRIDLAKSRTMDEAARAKLRERLVTLDADDEMATLLAMHDRMRRLESEVAALQLRVSQLATPLPAAPAAMPRAVAPAANAAMPAQVAPAKSASEGAPAVKEKWSFPRGSGLALAVLVALLAAALAWRLRRRALESQVQAAWDAEVAAASGTAAARFAKPAPVAAAVPVAVREADSVAPEPVPPRAVEPPVPVLTEAPAPAAPPSPVEALDPDEVIAAARRHYEEGALLHAVQRLQSAIEASPREVRPWLALLELLRREGLAVDHAELAVRFHQIHGEGEAWRKVKFFGRELDPTNPLYRDDDPQPLHFDPLAESWLDMPASFDDALATELRHSLLRDAARVHPKHAPTPLA